MAGETTKKQFEIEDLTNPWDLEMIQDWLIESLIPANTVTMLSGESGCGKSTVSLLLADAVANGKPFLGHATKQIPVLIVDKENGLAIYKERFKRLNLLKCDDIRYWGGWEKVEPKGPDFAAILRYAERCKPLIIFDSFVAFHPGNEQDATETRKYMDGYRKLAQTGATVIFIHHTGKGENTKDYRGSSDIKASVDMAYVLMTKKPLLQLMKLRNIKSREGVVEDALVSLEGDQLVVLDQTFVQPEDDDWKQIISTVKRNPGSNQSQIINLLPSMAAPKVRKVLMAAEMKGAIMINKGLHNSSLYYLGVNDNAQ